MHLARFYSTSGRAFLELAGFDQMSDTKYSTVAVRFKKIDKIDDEWLKDKLSDDGINKSTLSIYWLQYKQMSTIVVSYFLSTTFCLHVRDRAAENHGSAIDH